MEKESPQELISRSQTPSASHHRKPASEGTGTGKEKPLTIRKNYYKKDDRYGFVVGQREVMYVPSSHLVDNA